MEQLTTGFDIIGKRDYQGLVDDCNKCFTELPEVVQKLVIQQGFFTLNVDAKVQQIKSDPLFMSDRERAIRLKTPSKKYDDLDLYNKP